MIERAPEIRLKDYSRKHVLVAATLVEYGDTLTQLGLFEQAQSLLEEAVATLSDRADLRARRANETLARFHEHASEGE